MDSTIWGPGAWTFLHSITFNYPIHPTSKQKQEHYNFFKNLENILPCNICKNHYKHNLNKFPLNENILSNKNNFIKWLIDIHNSVNQLNGKKIYTYNEVIKLYNNKYFDKNNYNYFIYIFVFLFILIIIYLYLKRK